ncbi:MlaD family protein [Mycobacteroides chelonae]|uniref:Mammalian cell entry protein n=1 Tax=Mycobacteroides chelonae TaxID=1774 RepID=A0A1S1M6Q6_MYCCH|nr:MlaD family protein [Mycobacteroides chelonae]OHU78213.1 mammalian cell entry protein [Mycobacteroides chelonae]QQG86600.1 MCE family protein [Mycobacteroides chelonae]QQG91417.1 MCE family protein [Mycobacteroides chelonae]
MAEQSRWQRFKSRPVETYNKTWLGLVAITVVVALIGVMLLVKALGLGYRSYTAEFVQAASLRPGQPITVAGIPVGSITSLRLAGDHVEAGLSVRDDVILGKDTKASIRVTTILGSRFLDLRPDGPGSLPNRTIDIAHTEVPYDLQATLKDVTTTFEQVDFDKVAHSLSVLGKQLDGLPEVVPQAMENIQRLSSIIADRRDQLGTLLKSSEKITNTLRSQQSSVGTLINQGQALLGEFVSRRGTFHAMMQALTNLVEQLGKIVITNRPQLDEMLKTMQELSGMLGKHDDLFRDALQAGAVAVRGVANSSGTGNAIDFNITNGIVIDSWMCAISSRAKQFGMIQYFKDCK